MEVPFRLNDSHDIEPHHFRVYEAISNVSDAWLEALAEEEVRPRIARPPAARTV